MEYVKKLELAILVVIAIVCVWRFFTKERDDPVLAPFSGMNVSVEGVIVNEPELRRNGTRVLLDVDKISLLKERTKLVPQVIEGDKHFVLATVQTSIDLRYGDLIEIEGKLERPEIIVGDDGRSFDYPNYLGKDGIYFLLKGNKVELISHHNGSRIKEYLFRLKQAFIDRINESMPEPYSLLASGLVVAGKGALSDDLEEQFKRVGLIHIVVLSGSNVTIIAEAITRALSLLPKFIASAGGIFGIIAFTIIAGTTATVVRSAIMSIVAVLAKTFGRTTDALRALIIAACGMTLLNPDIVLYDPSFQLSFTGTLGLILLSEQTSKWFHWVPVRGGLREIVSASVASQISITPMILHMSGMFSFVSLFVNILVLPLLPLTMLVVFVTGCLRFISPVLSVPSLVVSYALLGYELKIVDFFSGWQYAATTIPALPWLAVLGIYATYVLIYMAYRIYKKSRQ
jgi:competence protein ComEC